MKVKDLTFEQLLELRRKLPPAVLDFYTSEEIADKIKSATKKYDLRVDQAGILYDEVDAVLLGITPSNEFENELRKNLKLDPNKISQLIADINRDIFIPIRNELIGMGGEKTEVKTDKPQAAPKPDAPPEGLERSMPRDIESIKHPRESGDVDKKDPSRAETKDKTETEKTKEEEPFVGVSKIAQQKMTHTTSSSGYNESDPYREPLE